MCGISGVLSLREGVDARTVETMSQTLTHRGPDDGGSFVEDRVGLGFRRLAIIDLSSGRQPMANEDGSLRQVRKEG